METLVGVTYKYLEQNNMLEDMLKAYCKLYPDKFHINMNPVDMVRVEYAFEKVPNAWRPHDLWWEWSYSSIRYGVNIADFKDENTIMAIKNAFISAFGEAFGRDIPYEDVEIR